MAACMTVLLITCLLAGIGVLTFALFLIWQAVRAWSWPLVDARLIQAEIVEECNEGCSYVLAIRYEYWVDGRRYEGDRARVVDAGWVSRRSHRPTLDRILATAESPSGLRVRYDPAKPQRSVIFPGVSAGEVLALGFSAVFVGVFSLLLWFKE